MKYIALNDPNLDFNTIRDLIQFVLGISQKAKCFLISIAIKLGLGLD
jgi:hypothetical protein